MNTIKKSALLAPLLGTSIATIIAIVYNYVIAINTLPASIIKSAEFWGHSIAGTLPIIPLVFAMFLLFAYMLTFTVGVWLYKMKLKHLFSESAFLGYSFLLGLLLGLILGYINYQFKGSVSGYIIFVLCISLGSLFTSSLFIVLSGNTNKIKTWNNRDK